MTPSFLRFPSDPAVGLGRVGPVFMNVWLGVPSVQTLTQLREAQRTVTAPHVVLTVVQEIPRGRLSDESRELAEKIQQDNLDRVRAHANVVEVQGFFGAAVRMVMTSGNLMKASRYPIKVLSEVDESLLWLAPHITALDPHCTTVVVKQSLQQLRVARST